jgi:hypothetical protein
MTIIMYVGFIGYREQSLGSNTPELRGMGRQFLRWQWIWRHVWVLLGCGDGRQ